jgi:hypothetical protein
MKGKRIVLTCTIAALTVSMGAMANEIYKWTECRHRGTPRFDVSLD